MVMTAKVARPKAPQIEPAKCPHPKSKGKHLLVITENPHNTDTYLSKCKWCGRYLQKQNDK